MAHYVEIQSFNGMGDLLMITPILRSIKERFGDSISIKINTNYPELVFKNPFVDIIGKEKRGLFMGYPDPIHQKLPHQHHIRTNWEILCQHYKLPLHEPNICPELNLLDEEKLIRERTGGVAVQNIFNGKYRGKKIWPYTSELAEKTGWEYIPKFNNRIELAEFLFKKDLIICVEGGIHHLAAAVGAPAIVIYGGFISPEWTGYSFQYNIENRLECSEACYNHHPCKNKEEHLCWKNITVNNVIDVAIKVLRKNACQIQD